MPAPTSNINLLPKNVIEERRTNQFLDWALTYGRYIIIVTELVVLLAFFSRFRLDQELTDLHTTINQKQAIIASVSDFETNVRLLQTRLSKIRQLDEGHTVYLDILTLLDQALPEDVILTTITLTNTHVELSANAFSQTGFAAFIQTLKKNTTVRNLHIKKVTKSEASPQALRFDINFDVTTNKPL